jgi:hypothetical protein
VFTVFTYDMYALNVHVILQFKNPTKGQAPVAHPCNPSYSGGRDQEDRCSKPDQANSLQDSILKVPKTEKGWWSGSKGRAPA